MITENQFDQRRELEDEDLEMNLDQDNEFEERDLRSKVLFAMQGLGGIRNIKKDGKQIEAYIKGDYCEESIKDLVKYMRKDSAENPKVCLILSQFNIIESDLIKILVLHAQDKKLSFWLLALIQYLTVKPSDNLLQSQKDKLNHALRQYKKTFMNNQGITYLILHISDYVKTPVQKRQKAHIQLMEFIIQITRNLLQIKGEDVGSDEVHSHFLLAMIKEDMLGPLFYLLQMEKGELIQRVDIMLLQIFYHVFTCFNPAILYDTKRITNLRQQAMKLSSKKPEPVRHSRFMPNFSEINQSGVNRIVHSLDKKQQPLAGQRKVPIKTAQMKKVKKIERHYIEQNFLEMIVDPQGDGNRKTVKQLVFEYAKQFVQVEFEHLSRLVFDSIYKQTAKVSKQNIIQYLMLSSWQLKMTRNKYQKGLLQAKTPQERGAVEFDFGQILCIMQTGHFELIYKLLYRQATREKKKQFDVNMFNAALILFLNYLQVIQDISTSFNMTDRKNASALMANMFRHDIARIFKIGFHQITHPKILKTLIITCYKFFKLLSEYSKGKVLTILTNKMLKTKRKGNRGQEEDQKDMEGFISHDSGSDQDDSFKQGEQDKKKKAHTKTQKQQEDEIRFQERRFNQMTEFAIIADYDIISKHIIFVKKQQFLNNSKQLNTAVFSYFQKIATLLKGQWLFFQAETLIAFHQVIKSSPFAKQYPKQRQAIKKICFSFVKLLRSNRLALAQSLFRYSNLQLKDQILKNYADTIDQNHQVIEHDFH